jgi:DNA helicase MCM8
LDGIKDIDAFIEALNLAGELLKCGRLYKSAQAALLFNTMNKNKRTRLDGVKDIDALID